MVKFIGDALPGIGMRNVGLALIIRTYFACSWNVLSKNKSTILAMIEFEGFAANKVIFAIYKWGDGITLANKAILMCLFHYQIVLERY